VGLLRDAGATEIHMRISSPPFLNPCYYGTDIDSKEHLVACRHTVEEIAKIMNVDSLGYLSIENVRKLTGTEGKDFCIACFNGEYPTEIPEKKENRYDCKISESKNKKG
jgi:amidophosphoribosyltransferase